MCLIYVGLFVGFLVFLVIGGTSLTLGLIAGVITAVLIFVVGIRLME